MRLACATHMQYNVGQGRHLILLHAASTKTRLAETKSFGKSNRPMCAPAPGLGSCSISKKKLGENSRHTHSLSSPPQPHSGSPPTPAAHALLA